MWGIVLLLVFVFKFFVITGTIGFILALIGMGLYQLMGGDTQRNSPANNEKSASDTTSTNVVVPHSAPIYQYFICINCGTKNRAPRNADINRAKCGNCKTRITGSAR